VDRFSKVLSAAFLVFTFFWVLAMWLVLTGGLPVE
jgi:hypothetical protein